MEQQINQEKVMNFLNSVGVNTVNEGQAILVTLIDASILTTYDKDNNKANIVITPHTERISVDKSILDLADTVMTEEELKAHQ